MKPKFICPLIVVKDINSSKEFYEKVLEQEVLNDFGENVTFKGAFAIHDLNHFSKLIDIETNPSDIIHHNFELYFEVDDLEDIQKRLEKNNIKFIYKIKVQPWQQKVIRFYDPDSHIVEVGESMEVVIKRLKVDGRTKEEIANSTFLPMQFIDSVFDK